MTPGAVAFLNSQPRHREAAGILQAKNRARLVEAVVERQGRFARNIKLPAEFADIRNPCGTRYGVADLDFPMCHIRKCLVGEVVR